MITGREGTLHESKSTVPVGAYYLKPKLTEKQAVTISSKMF